MKRIVAAVATVLVLGAALIYSRGTPHNAPPPAETPQACIRQMFASARAGDAAAYLACFTGTQLEQVERELAGQSAEANSATLRAAMASLKGLAMVDVQAPTPASSVKSGEQMAVVSVERVYEHHTEAQVFRLRGTPGGGWQIAAIEQPQNQQPPIAYGTHISEPVPPPTSSASP